jgi:hypothetical protein
LDHDTSTRRNLGISCAVLALPRDEREHLGALRVEETLRPSGRSA